MLVLLSLYSPASSSFNRMLTLIPATSQTADDPGTGYTQDRSSCPSSADWTAVLFLASGYAELFEQGDPGAIAGKFGVELARKLTPAYWAGWTLAEYQWFSGRKFKDIFNHIKLPGILLNRSLSSRQEKK